MRIVLLGPPGAGKGTHAKMLAAELKVPHISTGDLLRSNVAGGTELGRQAKDFMNKGLLVPDTLVTDMLRQRLQQSDTAAGFILDGYPRNQAQAGTLDGLLKTLSLRLDAVVNLQASDEVIVQRLCGRLVCRKCSANYHRTNMPPKQAGVCDACGGELYQRDDDKEETIRRRLSVYKQEASALLSFYRPAGLVKDIQADGQVQQVLQEIIKAVRP